MALPASVWQRYQTRRHYRKLLRPQPPRLVEVATFQDGASAYIVAGSLNAAGIRAAVHVEQRPGGAAYGASAPGPMHVVVRAEDEAAARRELG